MQLAHRPNKVAPVKCSAESFYRMWMEVLTPWHRLSAREKDVAARVLSQRARLAAQCTDPSVLADLLWSQASREDMRDSLGMSHPHFQLVLRKLRRAGFLSPGGEVNRRFLPAVSGGQRTFELRVVFDWSSPVDREAPAAQGADNG